MGMKQVYVSGIALDREREFPVVLIKAEDGEEVLPIWIGAAEAAAIFTVLAGRMFERPMTHDLMKLIVEELGAQVGGIEIMGLQDDTYFARIVLRRGDDLFYIDARPSDSLALALRAQAPVYIDEDLFERHKRIMRVGRDGDDADSQRYDEIDPDEFGPAE